MRASSRLLTTPKHAHTYTPVIAVRSFPITPCNMGRISDAIIQDHKELKEYHDKIMSASDHKVQTEYQNQFVWELARHSVAEEIVVYPAMEKHISNGKEMADRDRQEHQAVSTPYRQQMDTR